MNILAFTFFLFLSTIFWFSIAINKNYIGSINHPIKFKNFPENRIQSGELPEKFELTVETTGKKILRYRFWSKIDPINIDLSKCFLAQQSKKDSSRFYVLTKAEKSQISSQLPSDIHILEIKPDTLKFRFDFLKEKKVPVFADVEINCAPQYMLIGNPLITPDSVIMSGPASILDTLQYIHTKHISISGVKEPIEKKVDIKKIKGLNVEGEETVLHIDVDSYTEERINIPIIPYNVPDSLRLRLFPSRVSISFFVPYKIYSDIKSEDFVMSVDYNNIGLMNNEKLRINLDRKPENIKITGWEPRYVEYIIEK